MLARWQLRALQGDPSAGDDLRHALASLRGSTCPVGTGEMERGVAAALDGEVEAARQAFAAIAALAPLNAWHWSVALGLTEPVDPPATADPWQQALTDRLLGQLSDGALTTRAQATSGPRARARRLHEANALLALLASRDRDRARELLHLQAAASHGDMGGVLDVRIHARARRLGAPVAHGPPRAAAPRGPT